MRVFASFCKKKRFPFFFEKKNQKTFISGLAAVVMWGGLQPTQGRTDEPVPNYRRNRLVGGCYLFTVNLRDRRSDLLVIEIEALRTAVRAARARHPFHIDAWVVLPDHIHFLWTLPPDDSDFPVRWQMIKAMFSRSVPWSEDRRASLVRKREAGIWQRRYWEHTIRDERECVGRGTSWL